MKGTAYIFIFSQKELSVYRTVLARKQ